MPPHIEFNITGLKGITVSGDTYSFSVGNLENIKVVKLILDNGDIVGVRVTFSDEIVIDDPLIFAAQNTVELFIMNIIGNLDADVLGLDISIGNINNPNLPPQEGPLKVHSSICLSCSVSIVHGYSINRYKTLFTSIPTTSEKKDAFFITNTIMKIDNIAIRYLMQYELLMSLVSPGRKQKEVTEFIQNKYNPTLTFNQIGFHPTRRPGKTFDEDDITYYRNILAHNDSSTMPEGFEKIIPTMSKAINRVLFFVFDQMD